MATGNLNADYPKAREARGGKKVSLVQITRSENIRLKKKKKKNKKLRAAPKSKRKKVTGDRVENPRQSRHRWERRESK